MLRRPGDERDAGGNSSRAPSRALRGGLLLAVWSISGAWAFAHAWNHARHEQAVERFEREAGPVVAVEATHDHGHAHPEILPVAINGKGSQPIALVAPHLALDLAPTGRTSRRLLRAVPARTAPWAGTPSGPRAPPIA